MKHVTLATCFDRIDRRARRDIVRTRSVLPILISAPILAVVCCLTGCVDLARYYRTGELPT